ncbi:RNA-directed DNA polymerase, eukaryota [Tanacetum coccineum]
MGVSNPSYYNSKEDQTQKISKSGLITNFPYHFTARGRWNVCLAYGNVVDVYIPFTKSKVVSNSFAVVLKSGTVNPNIATESSPAIVLDDSCIMERDFSCSLMGKIKDINALSNLYIILVNEGFEKVKFSYLGGHWVLLEMDSVTSKEKIIKHVGVGSWFEVLKPACNSFVCKERLVWVSIEGLPVKSLTRNTFTKIISSWGELVDIVESENCSLSCIRVSWKHGCQNLTLTEDDTSSKEESEGNNENDLGSDNEHVSETSFIQENDAEFQKNPNPRFTPVDEENVVGNNPGNTSQPNPTKSGNNKNDPSDKDICNHGTKFQAGGSILEVMDELIKMNFLSLNIQDLGNKAKKGWIQELNTKHSVNFVALQETKMNIMDLFSIKALWGNLSFDYAFSPSIGYSGGILCIWDPSLFVKDNSMVSDSFLAISGTWIPSSTKLLIISVYAPQDLTERKMLWDFIRHLIDSWDGECILLGDFNEVRYEHERHGSLFNSHGANSFNNFITMTCLSDLHLEGYSFTWAHKSASKMSKLDRFLIFEGLLALFPSISALCLDKHLSDHRPILLRELNAIEGDENSKFFRGIINKKRSQLAIRGVSVDVRFGIVEQINLPDGFTFEFYCKYWNLIDHDVVAAVTSFFSTGTFPPGCNSSFIALIPKSQEAKMVKDFRPISLIGSMYKTITKILVNRLSLVISELISDVQSDFVSNRQILGGPFILNELLSWCKHNNTKAFIFKIEFEKDFDLVRWDYLDVVLNNFGFGPKWRSWIQGCLNSVMGSILINGSLTSEFKLSKGLKHGDPLSPFLFILIMESLHLSYNNVVNAGLYNGIHNDYSLSLSHLFYADDVIFVGKWNLSNLSTIVNILKWFCLASFNCALTYIK